MEPATWGPLADQAGAVGALILFVSGFVRGWWITGREAAERERVATERLEEMREDRDYWRAAADRTGAAAQSRTCHIPA